MLKALSNNYGCLQAHVNNTLTWQSSCVIANNEKQQVLFVQGYVTGTYVIIVLVYRRLLTTSLGGKAAA